MLFDNYFNALHFGDSPSDSGKPDRKDEPASQSADTKINLKSALILEDNEANLIVIEEYLIHYGITDITICKSIAEMRQTMLNSAADDYALMIFDEMLPDGESIELFEEVRRQRPSVVMGFYTARTADAERNLYKMLGSDFLLAKPLLLEEMTEQLDEARKSRKRLN